MPAVPMFRQLFQMGDVRAVGPRHVGRLIRKAGMVCMRLTESSRQADSGETLRT